MQQRPTTIEYAVAQIEAPQRCLASCAKSQERVSGETGRKLCSTSRGLDVSLVIKSWCYSDPFLKPPEEIFGETLAMFFQLKTKRPSHLKEFKFTMSDLQSHETVGQS